MPGPFKTSTILDSETVIGRIYRERVPAGVKFRWFLQIIGASPNSGSADTLDEAKADSPRATNARGGGRSMGDTLPYPVRRSSSDTNPVSTSKSKVGAPARIASAT